MVLMMLSEYSGEAVTDLVFGVGFSLPRWGLVPKYR